MTYISQYKYYDNEGNVPNDLNWGSYQYVSLTDIVRNFELMYTGNHSLINNEPRYKILFHAKRAIQELNYDALRCVKVLSRDITDQLKFVLPSDYVNWVKISQYRDGYIYPLTENQQVMSSEAYLQDNSGDLLFDEDGNVLQPEKSDLDMDRISGAKKSIYLNDSSSFNGYYGYNIDGQWFFDYGNQARFGLNTSTANANPTFKVNKKSGVIDFDSSMSGQTCILEYISDGLEEGDDASVSVNKLFEEVVYAYIEYMILQSKVGAREYEVRRKKNRYYALLRNAKIRISNMHPERLLMALRGRNKWIK